VTDENEQKRTQYRYESGIANSLPAGYKGIFSQNTLYNHEFNLLGPGPGVGYSKVSVYETDATGQMIGAKIVHEYFTGKDFPFTVTVGNVTWNYEYNEYRQPVTIVDQTGMYGKIKRITVLGLKQTSGPPEEIDFDPVRTDDFLYQMSSALGTSEIPINGDISDQRFKQIYLPSFEPLDQSQLLGLTQRSYKTTGGKPSSGNIFITAYIDLRRENVFLVGTKSKTYPANGVSQSTAVETRSYTIAYDALSGRDQCTESSTSKQERLIAESIPAYWNYEGMRAKNMLSQESIKRTYLLGPSDDFFSLRSNSALYPKLLSASATTWKDWHNTDLNEDNVVTSNEQSWRQNDTYTATKTGSNHFDFTIWTAADNESTNPETYDFPNGWRRTSNITAYDRYGHPTEERGLDGTYTSSIYGYGDALPIAIAQNAKTSQIRFYNFENSSYTSGGKTGDYSKLYSGTVAEMATPNVPGTYMISGWIKPTSSTTVGGKTYPADGQWHYFEVKNVTANTTPSLSGQGVIDDIRIHPMDATMSTFTYDNLTWKVTAISDANSIITYYEYDGAGRLVKVYDQDKNLIKKHTYQYRRN
jgi:YD repeat-containing protein